MCKKNVRVFFTVFSFFALKLRSGRSVFVVNAVEILFILPSE